MREHGNPSHGELAAELAREREAHRETRAALETALRIGYGLQARVDNARQVAAELPPIPSRGLLLAALDGGEQS